MPQLLSNLLSAPILFFLAGVLAVLVRSDLEIPSEIAKALSLYLLFAIGLKGGVELGHSGLDREVVVTLGLALLFAIGTPFVAYWALRFRFDVANAAAIASTYGSVSAVTFVTAISFLQEGQIPYGGHMVAALALMESPAIIVGVLLMRWRDPEQRASSLQHLVHDALTNGSVFLVLASVAVGLLLSEANYAAVKPLSEGLFKGMLTLFLLDMGILAAKRAKALKRYGPFAGAFAVIAPCVNAALMIAACWLLDVDHGNALLLTVLAASASYIAVPAALRTAIPQANPGLYVPLALGVTFPFNVIVGIPLYHAVLEYLG
jgi:hypothetical protein